MKRYLSKIIATALYFSTLTAQSQDYIIAMTGSDCVACEVNLSNMLSHCLSDKEVLYVFPGEYESPRHWSKNLKKEYQPHVFSDSLFLAVTDNYPVSVMAEMEGDQIAKRYVVKQAQCDDLKSAQEPVLDSLDLNKYVTGSGSSFFYVEEDGFQKLLVISNSHQLHIIDPETGEESYTFDTRTVSESFETLLHKAGLSDLLIKANLHNRIHLGEDPLVIESAYYKDSVLRMTAALFHVSKMDTIDERPKHYLSQKQMIMDLDMRTGEYSIISFPLGIPGLEKGHYYSVGYSEFIDFDLIMLQNSVTSSIQTHSNTNYYGMVRIRENGELTYIPCTYPVPKNLPLFSPEGISQSFSVHFYEDPENEFYLNVSRSNVLVNSQDTNQVLVIATDSLAGHGSEDYHGNPWVDKVFTHKDRVLAVVIDADYNTTIQTHDGKTVLFLKGSYSYVGHSENTLYLHKNPLTGVVLRVAL